MYCALYSMCDLLVNNEHARLQQWESSRVRWEQKDRPCGWVQLITCTALHFPWSKAKSLTRAFEPLPEVLPHHLSDLLAVMNTQPWALLEAMLSHKYSSLGYLGTLLLHILQVFAQFLSSLSNSRIVSCFPHTHSWRLQFRWLCSALSYFHITFPHNTEFTAPVLSIAYLSSPLECKLIHSWPSINIYWMNITFYIHISLCLWLPGKNLEFTVNKENNKKKLLKRYRVYIQYPTCMCIWK